MKKNLMTIRGLLAALASLLLLSACSKDTTPAASSRIHVSIGAGYGTEGTKSAVSEQDGGARTLLFTEGDRLFFNENIDDDYRMGGTLTAVSVSEDGKSATFSGDLTVYKNTDGNWVATEYDLANPDDPMKEFRSAPRGYLIHKDAPEDWCTTYIDGGSPDFNYQDHGLCGDVNTLMRSVLEVNGMYSSDKKCFELGASFPVLNCTISGLTPNSEFYVRVESAGIFQYYEQAVTTDDAGTARFVITFPLAGPLEYRLQFSSNWSDLLDFEVDLGELGSKVYNVTRTATAVQ
jgi:hypothetical protein